VTFQDLLLLPPRPVTGLPLFICPCLVQAFPFPGLLRRIRRSTLQLQLQLFDLLFRFLAVWPVLPVLRPQSLAQPPLWFLRPRPPLRPCRVVPCRLRIRPHNPSRSARAVTPPLMDRPLGWSTVCPLCLALGFGLPRFFSVHSVSRGRSAAFLAQMLLSLTSVGAASSMVRPASGRR
jgi:hypothetical protein